MKSNVEIEKLAERKSDDWKFDDKCYMELSEIFNANAKWKSVANMLGYQNFLGDWQNSRSPTKVLFMFAEVCVRTHEPTSGSLSTRCFIRFVFLISFSQYPVTSH